MSDLRKRVEKIMKKDPRKTRMMALRMAQRDIQKENIKRKKEEFGKEFTK